MTNKYTVAVVGATGAVGEAMLALVLMDQALRHRAQCGDVGAMAPRIPAGRP